MIPNAPDLRAAPSAPDHAPTEASTLYFNARVTQPTRASLLRDARPTGALEQMFGYYEA